MQKGPETKKTEILVLDSKRSNAINIGMTVLPAIHVIKSAILSFDEFAISKEGIEVGVTSCVRTDRCDRSAVSSSTLTLWALSLS